MATPYSLVFKRALFKIKDRNLSSMSSVDQQTILYQYMLSSLADFEHKCKEDLSSRDDIMYEFKADLSNEVIEILASGISYYWYVAQTMDEKHFKNKLSTKDYTYFSPANLLREMNEKLKTARDEYKHRIINYTYDHGNVSMQD